MAYVQLFTESSAALAPSIAVRRRFHNDRRNAKPSWSQAELDGFDKEFAAINSDAERVARGESILVSGSTMLMGYHSPLDDSDQPYSLFIPSEYDGSNPFPLVLFLHGQGMFNPLQCHAAPIGNFIVAAPQGRGGMDYMYVGEDDVLSVLRHVQKLLKIDADRVCLAGHSMGGTGSWHLASHFPDLFAGIMATSGNTDINVWANLWHWRTPADSPQSAVRQFLREDTSSVTYAPNLHNVSVIALQGEADPIVNKLHAKQMQEALEKEGHPKHAFHLLPYVTHSYGVNFDPGLQTFKREEKPLRVRYKTAWLRYPGAYWIRINGIARRLRHAIVDAVADPKARTVQIKTDNVTELTILPQRLPFSGAPASIAIDLDVFTSGLTFRRGSNGRWSVAAPEGASLAPFPPRKSSELEGPLEHAFMTPFNVIPGAALDVEAATAAAALNAQWKSRFATPCRQNPGALTDPLNTILIGTPQTNDLIARIAGRLPVKWTERGIRFGGRDYSGDNLGLMLCYPNPLNPSRYFVLFSGTTPRSYEDIHVRFGNWFDWVPYDYRKHFDFAIFDDLTCGRHPESFLTWGFFGEDWQFNEATTFHAVPAFRKTLVPRVFPMIDLAKLEINGGRPASVHLDESFVASESVAKEYLERNRTLDGGPLQLLGRNYLRGLCCRFPCSLTFPAGGYKRFAATAGVGWDGVTEPCEDRKTFEKVHVTVQADGKPVFEAGGQTWRSEPLKIDVDISGAKSITLAANGGLSWLNGSFVWADASLY